MKTRVTSTSWQSSVAKTKGVIPIFSQVIKLVQRLEPRFIVRAKPAVKVQQRGLSIVKSGKIIDTLGSAQELAKLSAESIQYKRVLCNKKQPRALFIGNLHPDEFESAAIWSDLLEKEIPVSRIEVMNSQLVGKTWKRRAPISPLTAYQLQRLKVPDVSKLVITVNHWGMDEITQAKSAEQKMEMVQVFESMGVDIRAPLKLQKVIEKIGRIYEKGENLSQAVKLYEEHIELIKTIGQGKVPWSTSPELQWEIGYPLELNRVFRAKKSDTTWKKLQKISKQPESVLLQHLLSKNSQLEYVFSIHEDFRFDGIKQEKNDGGFYIYDVHHSTLLTEERAVLKKEFMGKVYKMGVSIHQGTDNEEDNRELFSEEGYINQPVISQKGKIALDGKFENFCVYTGYLGLTNIHRAFSFVIPGKMPKRKKKKLLKLIRDEFIVPLLNDLK